MSPFRKDDWQPNEDNGDDGKRFSQEKREQMQRALVVELLSHSEHAGKAYEILTDRIQTINAAGVRSNPHVILDILGNSDPELVADSL